MKKRTTIALSIITAVAAVSSPFIYVAAQQAPEAPAQNIVQKVEPKKEEVAETKSEEVAPEPPVVAQEAPAVENAPVEPVAPATPPAQPVVRENCDLVYNYAWDHKVAYAVCMAESNGNPYAANLQDRHNGCTGSFGLMQIACIHGGIIYDPKANMDKAFEIYTSTVNKGFDGWRPWGAYTSGKYQAFM